MQKGNIIGEPFAEYVNEQIKQRQIVYGDGLNSNRDPKYIQYLNSRTSWIKMASSVVVVPNFTDSLQIENQIKFDDTDKGIKKLKDLGFSESEIGNFVGVGLAKKSVLFNSLSDGGIGFKSNEEGEVDTTVTSGPIFNYTPRKGITNSNSIWNNSAYGLGGLDFGIQPPPGIISFNVDSLNRGSIRKGSINLKAYNKVQFEIINLLYLRLGFSMLVEWGNSQYISNNGEYINTGNTYIEKNWFNNPELNQFELLKKLEEIRKNNDGNVDGFFCKVSNYSWSFNTDGSYDITIDLISLGDVIESLKVNTLSQNYPYQKIEDDSTTDEEWDKNDIENHLKSLINNPEYFTKPRGEDEEIILLDLYRNEFGGIFSGKTENKAGVQIDEKYRYYYRLGNFLEFLNIYIVPYVNDRTNEKNTFPLIDIDTESDFNIMSIYPNQISFDPHVCLVKNTTVQYKKINVSDDFATLKPYDPFFYSNMNTFNGGEGLDVYGKIMNIYLNFEFIKTLLKNTDSKGYLNLFDFLKKLCEGVNKSLGGINNLEPVVIEERNTIVLLDQNIVAENDKIRESLKLPNYESTLFNLYGYQGNESNFVKSYSLNTKITPDLSSIITIGSTAAGTVTGEDGTFFSKLNEGLVDKFKIEIANKKIPFPPLKEENEESNGSFFRFLKELYNEAKELITREQRTKTRIETDFNFWLGYIFGPQTRFSKKYLENSPSIKSQSFSKWKKYIDELGLSQRLQGSSLNTIGFIPLTLGLTLDGISGLKIYQKLKVNTKFLPSGFPEDMDFIITKVNHSLQDNEWTTSLEALSVPKTKPFSKEIQEKEALPRTGTPPSNLIFFSPITSNSDRLGALPLPLIIRQDSGGDGRFLARRDNGLRYHKGIDIKTVQGQQIYSPIDGKTTSASAQSGAPGITVIGTGKFTNYRATILYTGNNLPPGTIVKKGDPIAQAIGDLGQYYSSDVTPHIHFKLIYIKPDETESGTTLFIDPTNLNYTNLNANATQPNPEVKFINEEDAKFDIKVKSLDQNGRTVYINPRSR